MKLRKFPSRILTLGALCILLATLISACTVVIEPGRAQIRSRVSIGIGVGFELDRVITEFQPTKGEGATFQVGEPVTFRAFSRRSGFLTITSLEPDGNITTLARNIEISEDQTIFIPSAESRFTFVAEPPTGRSRIRALYHPRRVDPTGVDFGGLQGEREWNDAIIRLLRPFETRDVQETSILVVR